MNFLRIGLAVSCALLTQLVFAAGERLPLWEASKPGRPTVYLFGSVHVCKASCFPLPESALQRLKMSEALVVELDPQRPGLQEKVLAAALLPAGQTLSGQLSGAEWQALARAAQKVGLPSEALAPMHAWMANMLLILGAAQQAGLDVSQGIDLAFMQRAQQSGLALEELETLEEQLAAIAAGSPGEQREALNLTVQQLNDNRMTPYLNGLVNAWQQGDAAAIGRLLETGMPQDSALNRALIEARNRTMSERIEQRARDGRRRFVVVGVAHLVGKNGIPALLAQRGYRVRQIKAGE